MTGAEFELPVPVVLERGDVERLVGAAAPNLTKGELYYALADALGIDNPPRYVPPGLVLCPTCSTEQSPREGGRLAVHFPTRDALRPCAGSWPAKAGTR